jgi:hypothetical protein
MTDVSVATHVDGVREVLRELRKFDKKLVYKSQNRLKRAGAPILTEGRRLIAAGAASTVYQGGSGSAPLSGWRSSGRLGWNTAKAQKGLTIAYSGSYDKRSNTWPIMRVQQKSPAGMLYDWAGRSGRYIGASGRPARGYAFINNLPRLGYVKGSRFSRTVFPAVVKTRRIVNDLFVEALNEVSSDIQKRIGG